MLGAGGAESMTDSSSSSKSERILAESGADKSRVWWLRWFAVSEDKLFYFYGWEYDWLSVFFFCWAENYNPKKKWRDDAKASEWIQGC